MINKKPRLFYGWLIVFVCAVGLFLGAPLMIFSFSVFFKPLVVDFHASRAGVSFAFSLFNTVGALWLPGTGMLIDRFGAKRVILVFTRVWAGFMLCPVGGYRPLAALRFVHHTWNCDGERPVAGLSRGRGFTLVRPPPGARTWAGDDGHWRRRRRGADSYRAPYGPLWLAHDVCDLRGGNPACAASDYGHCCCRTTRKSVGCDRMEMRRVRLLHVPQEDKQGLSWTEIWHSRTFWMMICIFSLAGASVHGAILHMSSIFTDRAISAEHATLVTSLVGAAVVVGRLGSGLLLDHVFAPRVAILFYGAATLGIGILCAGLSGNIAFVAAFLVGLGMGAEVETMGYMISRYFGLRAFGTAYGHTFGAFMISGAAGVTLMGVGYDHFHSYAGPLAGFCAAMILVSDSARPPRAV